MIHFFDDEEKEPMGDDEPAEDMPAEGEMPAPMPGSEPAM